MDRIEVESSNITSIGYDPEDLTLEVEFNSGAAYQYFDVEPEVYEGLMNANSHGSYFYQNIRLGGYRYKRVE